MTNKSDDKLKERIKKLKALAERGVGGEKDTAQRKLDKLLADNNLSESDLFEDKVEYYLFSYNGQHKRRLLSQIIYKVVGVEKTQFYRSKHTRNKIGTYCTAAEKIEIELEYEFYSSLFDEEIGLLLDAFISKQDLYPEDVPCCTLNPEDLTTEELEKWKKLHAYEATIDKKRRAAAFIEEKEGA